MDVFERVVSRQIFFGKKSYIASKRAKKICVFIFPITFVKCSIGSITTP